MHIGLILYGSLHTLTGGYLYDRLVVEHLQAAGHQVSLISLPWRNYPAHLTDNFSRALLQKIVSGRFDLIVQDELNHPSLFWLNHTLRQQTKAPIVSIVHHLRSLEWRPGWQNKVYGWVERRYLQTISAFIFNSQDTQHKVANCLGRPLPPHVVAYPAGDRLREWWPRLTEEQLYQRSHRPGPLHILFVGHVIPRKGLETLLQAVGLLPAGSWHLDIVGNLKTEMGYALELQRLVAKQGWSKQVQFLGAVDNKTLVEKFAKAQVLVVPSTYEGFGIVYLEGMSFGLPAVGTTFGAAGEIITPGWDGFLIPPHNHRILAQHLETLHRNRALLLEMSLHAQQRFDQHPTWQESCHKIERFLYDLHSL
jgi:glycosyltransferase involved in cell wall biosynthesis